MKNKQLHIYNKINIKHIALHTEATLNEKYKEKRKNKIKYGKFSNKTNNK